MIDADVSRQRARNLLILGRLDDARAAVAEHLSSHPDDARAIRLLAEIELAADDLELARDHAQSAVGLLPEPHSFLVLASIERRAGQAADAVTACERGLDIEPEHPGLLSTLSLSWSSPWVNDRSFDMPDARRRAIKESRAAAARSLDIDPERPVGHYAAACAELAANDPVSAAQALERGLELQADWRDGHLLMSAIRARQGMVKLASRHLATAGRLDPTDQEPINLLRRMRGQRRVTKRPPRMTPWWLDADAREVLRADDEFGVRP